MTSFFKLSEIDPDILPVESKVVELEPQPIIEESPKNPGGGDVNVPAFFQDPNVAKTLAFKRKYQIPNPPKVAEFNYNTVGASVGSPTPTPNVSSTAGSGFGKALGGALVGGAGLAAGGYFGAKSFMNNKWNSILSGAKRWGKWGLGLSALGFAGTTAAKFMSKHPKSGLYRMARRVGTKSFARSIFQS